MLCLPLFVSARHIIGGDISYVCLGDGNYQFTMKIYRDCSNPFGDNFDFNAPVTIFRGNTEPYTQVQHIYAPLQQPITNVPPDLSNPCLILPPNVCVEQGVYIFNLSLPVIDESYHIVYQRCCRNNTITNILNPGASGATYAIELTPDAQSLCNNSPVFNAFPPVVICSGEELNFDHSATDADGDQLVYELCSPLLGAGVVGFMEPGDPTSCDGFRPDPACPPPFDNVNFQVPNYSPLEPMGGDPVVSIDPVTGIISGVPTTLGQFVVGICVYEYRNGELLSVTRRDFQFNVANCEPTVFARVDADDMMSDETFVIHACENPITLVNQSVQQQFIDEYIWEFDIDGVTHDFHSWNLPIEFPHEGLFEGRLILNPGTDCGDTATVHVHVFPGLEADFEFDYDTCIAGPVIFTNTTTNAGAQGIESWEWSFGDNHGSEARNPIHEYFDPGHFPVNLRVTDDNGCVDQITKTVDYQPVPALIIIAPSSFDGCSPADIFFDNLSYPIDDTYQINWDFGDGTGSPEISPSHVFEETGKYSIEVEITSPIGCTVDTFFHELIEVRPSPIAAFNASPEELTQFNSTVQFEDQSEGGAGWFWQFGDDFSTSVQHPEYTFRDTGLQEVQLIVTNAYGCQDTVVQYLDVKPEIRYHIPNAFTPNGDGQNDVFRGKGILEGIRAYQMSIWNRWGELIFSSNNPTQGWDGNSGKDGRSVPAGVYVYFVEMIGPRGERFEYQGFATLIR